MCSHKDPRTFTATMSSVILAAVVLLSPKLFAQEARANDARHAEVTQNSAQADKPLADQLLELRATVARLVAALEKNHQGNPSSPLATSDELSSDRSPGERDRMDSMKRMGSMKGGRSMKDSQMGSMGPMKSIEKGAMKGMGGMKTRGMSMMGKTGEMTWSRSDLPGFPGASHIYHIGATDFFLDHPEHITLSTEQQAALNKLREKAFLKRSSFDRQIDEAEQDLWELTSADQPDANTIEVKIREIERLRADQRLLFIRAVGDAAQALTEGQRQTLAGMASGQDSHTGAASHKDER